MTNLRLLLNLFFRWNYETLVLSRYHKAKNLPDGSWLKQKMSRSEGITTVSRNYCAPDGVGGIIESIPKVVWKGKLPRKIDKAYWRR